MMLKQVLILALFYINQLAFTDIYLNGELTPVFFNDGDTFRILEGPYKDLRARIEGVNALESYGAVHQWGSWTANELYDLSKEATKAARLGDWNCSSDFKKDTYGRILCSCDDLAINLLKKGLFHLMSVGDVTAKDSWIAAQTEAINGKKGIWKKGVPTWIVTSLHSIDEFNNKKAYDRLVSTEDGYSEPRQHEDDYEDCQKVCYSSSSKRLIDANDKSRRKESCMTYVGFNRRYGDNRASCLKN